MQVLQALQALQAALAAEDAAIYGYGVAGAHLSGSQQATAQQYWTSHREARDALTDMITARDATPVAALAYYDLPVTVTDTATAATLAATLEDGVTAAYLGMVAVASRRLRQYGALAMQDCAVRAAYWRGSTAAFPGLPLPRSERPVVPVAG
ncbi:MAG TPA: ferritin-like domain-containing protein [Streptosporangiaceae bacterium]|nr:ferritin-like domain-containing protein [Streptosporangiaceae bacterium]